MYIVGSILVLLLQGACLWWAIVIDDKTMMVFSSIAIGSIATFLFITVLDEV